MKFSDRLLTPEESVRVQRAIFEVAEHNRGCDRGVYIETFGCQQNTADSERVMGMAVAMGYRPVSDPYDAELIVVNTCAVREHAEKKALSVIGQFKHCKKQCPELKIAVCGCMVSQEHRARELKMKYPYVDITFPTSSLHMLPELLAARIAGGARTFLPFPEDPLVAEDIPIKRESDYRAYVSIMYGCNNFCSYCIVPYVRGRERSRRPEVIEQEVRELIEAGYKDITLLGQNVNSYGKDASFECDFADLLARLAAIEGDYKLHFMTSHPKDATAKLIDTMAGSEHIARQFHLPVQSGSDPVLRAMNRRYDREKYLNTVRYIRKMMPDAVITTDIIVGFPGETEEDFLATLSLLDEVRYDMVFSFIYSPRKGTPAAEMTCQVPDEVKGERMRRLLEMQTEIATEVNARELGKTLRVLCDGESKTDRDMLSGRTEGNKIVLFSGESSLRGEYVNIKITDARPFALYGEII